MTGRPDSEFARPSADVGVDRRPSSAPTHGSPRESLRDSVNEDFLFHLYRGSELLQDNRMLEAKTELEFALALQPFDPKGQDLLALVYFRIGHYPRAIQIYETLLRENPRDASLKLNLALCYLKTGQAQPARGELEGVVQSNPGHRRAWGYLGLAYERLGDREKAEHAFARGGHAAMAKRVADGASVRAEPLPAAPAAARRDVRTAATVAFEELDAGELSFALAEPEPGTGKMGQWHALEPGAAPSEVAQPPRDPGARGRRFDTLDWGIPKTDPTEGGPLASSSPRTIADVAREARLDFSIASPVALMRSGVALVQLQAGAPDSDFAVRLEAIRSYSGEVSANVMQRQVRGQLTHETFGGIGTPIVAMSGAAQLVVGARPGHKLAAFALREDITFIREDHVLGFEMRLVFENGRLAVGDGDVLHMVQLKGSGVVLIEMLEALATLEVTTTRSINVRREVLLGWVGRLVPRALPHGEAPCGQRGLVSFSGDGTILLAAR